MVKTSSLFSFAALGMIVGVFLGAGICLIASIGTSVLLPGVGLVIAGPLLAIPFGAGIGAIIGLMFGFILKFFVPNVSPYIAWFFNPISISMIVVGLAGIVAVIISAVAYNLLDTKMAFPGLGAIIPGWLFLIISGFGIGAILGLAFGIIIGVIVLIVKLLSGSRENRQNTITDQIPQV